MVSNRTIALLASILVLAVVLYFLASSNPIIRNTLHIPTFSQSGPSTSNLASSGNNSSKGASTIPQQSKAQARTTQLIGNYQNETLTISNNTVINITGNYNRIALYANNVAQVTVYVLGDYNIVNITGGNVNIGGYGNYDSVSINATSANGTIMGNNNQISRSK